MSTTIAGRRRFNWSQPFVYLIALVVVAVTIVPVIYVILNGFRTTAQINRDPGGLPDPWVFDKYLAVFQNPNFWVQVTNSSIVAVLTTTGVVILGVMAAFVIARYEFKGRALLYALFTAGLLFPLTVAVLPLFTMLRTFGPTSRRSLRRRSPSRSRPRSSFWFPSCARSPRSLRMPR